MRAHMLKRRQELDYSQEKVAEMAGMSRANYSHIERGRHSPSLEQMEAIAKALKVKPELPFFRDFCDKTEQGDDNGEVTVSAS